VRVLERLRRQVELIEEYVRELEYERSYRGIERLVQLVVQALLDLGTMVIAALNGPRPRSYSEVGAILRSLGVLGDEEADLVRSLAGLGNVLLHGYAVIDRGRVVEFASRLRGDATRLASAILRGAEGRPVDPGGPGPSGLEYTVGRARGVLAGRVLLAYLYGGRVKGYSLKGDYDVAVLLRGPCDPYEVGKLVVDLAEALGVGEGEVDVACLDALPPGLVVEALSGVPVVEEPSLAFELRFRALAELLDLEESLKLYGRPYLPST